jgi:GT2 family glycosyltransferase
MDLVILGVNFASSQFARRFACEWARVPHVTRVHIVDNYSTDSEVATMRDIAKDTGAEVWFRPNDGYGSALNDGLARILPTCGDDTLVLFGNVDVVPVTAAPVSLSVGELPEITVLQDGVDRNPFLTRAQKHLLPLFAVPSRFRSVALLWCVLAANKALGVAPARTWAVHGAMFGATGQQLRRLLPVFDPRAFLYCEELFFARRAEMMGYRFRRVPIVVSHVGSVSTSALKTSGGRHFDAWAQAIDVFLGRKGPNA